eukprot:m.270678 g.270678  ORF g.270678 m.270678 type:complete len:58 (+) comp15682_c0_seq13:2634-2807(+)
MLFMIVDRSTQNRHNQQNRATDSRLILTIAVKYSYLEKEPNDAQAQAMRQFIDAYSS